MKRGCHPSVETPCNKHKDTWATVELVTLLWHQVTAASSIRNASKAPNPPGAPSPAALTLQTGAPGPPPAKQTCNGQSYKCITKGKINPESLSAKKLLHWQLVEAFLFSALTQTRLLTPYILCRSIIMRQMPPDGRKQLAFLSPTSTRQPLCPQDISIKILFDLRDHLIIFPYSYSAQSLSRFLFEPKPKPEVLQARLVKETRILTLPCPSLPAGGNALARAMVTEVTFFA